MRTEQQLCYSRQTVQCAIQYNNNVPIFASGRLHRIWLRILHSIRCSTCNVNTSKRLTCTLNENRNIVHSSVQIIKANQFLDTCCCLPTRYYAKFLIFCQAYTHEEHTHRVHISYVLERCLELYVVR